MPNEKVPVAVSHALGIPTLFVGPLVMYFLFKRKASPWLRDHLDEAVNYHILFPVVAVVLLVTGLLLNDAASTLSLVLLILAVLVFALGILLSVVAAIWAARGKAYHYPLDIKMIR